MFLVWQGCVENGAGHAAGRIAGGFQMVYPDDLSAPPASGSSDYSSMVVLPCTMGTLAAIAGGLSINLIHRAADVMLKERKRLVLAVRETPFNRTHLKNMLAVHDAGAIICPTMPSYYLQPKTLEKLQRVIHGVLPISLVLIYPIEKDGKSSALQKKNITSYWK